MKLQGQLQPDEDLLQPLQDACRDPGALLVEPARQVSDQLSALTASSRSQAWRSTRRVEA